MSGNEIAEVRFAHSDSVENVAYRELSTNNNSDSGMFTNNREIDAVAQILPAGDSIKSDRLKGNNINEKSFLEHVAFQGLGSKKNTAKIQMGKYDFFRGLQVKGDLEGTIALESLEAEQLKNNLDVLKGALVAPKREIYAFQTFVDGTLDDTKDLDALRQKLWGFTTIEKDKYSTTAKLGDKMKTQRYVKKQEKQFLDFVKNNFSKYDGDITITTSVHYLNNWFDHHWDCDINFLATETDGRMWWPRNESVDCLKQMMYASEFDSTNKKWKKKTGRDIGTRVAEIVHFVAMKSVDTAEDEGETINMGRYSHLEHIVTSYCNAYAVSTTYLPFLIPMPKDYMYEYHDRETSFSDELAITQTLAGLRDANVCPVFFPKSEGFDYVMFSREPGGGRDHQKIDMGDSTNVFYGPAYENRNRNIPEITFRDYYQKRLNDTDFNDSDILREWLIGTNVIVDHKELVLADNNVKGTAQGTTFAYSNVDPTASLSGDYRAFIEDMFPYSEVNKYMYYGNYYDNNRRKYMNPLNNTKWLTSGSENPHPSRHQFFMFSGNPENTLVVANLNKQINGADEYYDFFSWNNTVNWKPKTPLCFTPPNRKKVGLSTFDFFEKFTTSDTASSFVLTESNETKSKNPVEDGIKREKGLTNRQKTGLLHSTSAYKYNPPFARILSLRLFPSNAEKETFDVEGRFKFDVFPTWFDGGDLKGKNINVDILWEKYAFLAGIYNFTPPGAVFGNAKFDKEKLTRSTYFKFFLVRLSSEDGELEAPKKIKKLVKSESQTKEQRTSSDLKTGKDSHLFLMRLKKYEKTLNSLLDLHGGRFEIFKDWKPLQGGSENQTENRAMWESIHNCGVEGAKVYWPRDNILKEMQNRDIRAWAFRSIDKETEISMRDDAWVFHNRFLSVGPVFVEFLQDLKRSLGQGNNLADSLNIDKHFHEIRIPAILVPLYTERANPKYHMWSSFLAWQKIAASAIMEENNMDMEEKIAEWNEHVGKLEDNASPGYRSYLEERMSVLVDSFLARGGLI